MGGIDSSCRIRLGGFESFGEGAILLLDIPFCHIIDASSPDRNELPQGPLGDVLKLLDLVPLLTLNVAPLFQQLDKGFELSIDMFGSTHINQRIPTAWLKSRCHS